jgi:ABC-type uncharacterized transport system involved in gliding motility auxiliary subunit
MPAFNRRSATIGTLVLIGIVLLAVLLISNALFRGARLDLTQNRLYTLSEGTRDIVGNLDEPISLYYFFSDQVSANIPQGQQLRGYANRVRELLEEVTAKSGGKINLRVIDPLPFSEEEDRASSLGLQPVPVGAGGENLFFGLAGTNSTDGSAIIPFFQMDKENFLEYDIAKLVNELGQAKKPVVGLISGLPLSGRFDPETRAMPQPWTVLSELQQLVEVRNLEVAGVAEIAADIGVLVLVHPKALDDTTLYAIDQFVLRGGRLLVFVDPIADADESGADPNNPTAAMFADRSSDLSKLFQAWGVQYDKSKVVLDARYAAQVSMQAGRPPVRHLGILALTGDALSTSEAITGVLGTINTATVGAISLAEGSALELVPLLQSSAEAKLGDAESLKFLPDPSSLFADFQPSGDRYVLAGRLHGTFKTAFPERSGETHLAESKEAGNVVVVADTDLLTDRMWVQVQNFLGQRLINAFANNGDFFVNAVDTLSGSSSLIGIRGRATATRPFTTVEAIQRNAEERFRNTEQQLQQELTDLEQRLNELQSGRQQEAGGALILSAEQRQELENFRKRQIEIRRELRQVRRQLDADIDSLGAWLKFLNVWLLPVLLTLAVAGFIWWRRRRTRQPASA